MNHLDNDIQDYSDDAVDGIYADGDAPARGWDPSFVEEEPQVERTDQRWRPVAAIAGIVLMLAVIATVVILNGGDSASTSAIVTAPPTRTVIATPRPTAPPIASLPPETVTTVTPPPRKPTSTTSAGPTAAPTVVSPPEAGPPVPPDLTARTFVYQVTGTKQLLDLVTVIYTDAQGVPQTDLNVSLPWSRTVMMDPGVPIRSVVATSLTSHLNCSITDGAGQAIAMSTSGSIIATCTR